MNWYVLSIFAWVLTSLWMGSYVLSSIPTTSWQHFPASMTCGLIVLGGPLLIALFWKGKK